MAFGWLRQTWRSRQLWGNPVAAMRFFRRARVDARAIGPQGGLRLGQLRFFARMTDWCAIKEVAFDREYAFIEPLLASTPAPVVVDVGANIGMFALYVLSLRPKARVCSIEPSTQTFELLDRNRRANPSADWRVLRLAAWREDGSVRFENREFSTSSRIDSGSNGDELVTSISLPTLLSRHVTGRVDLMKIDIEGAEEATLVGHENLLSHVEHLIVEIHPALCAQERVQASLKVAFPHLYRIPGRRCSKPLVLATRHPQPLPEFL